MGKHSDFRISSFQEVDAWRILKFKWKTEKYFKSLYGFGGRCYKIRDIVWIFNHVSRVITCSLFDLRAPNLVK